ncbi:MAG: UPF0182 family protein [Acidimicrobiia bacterium]|nr:UPF0182 family protein [Acidimicrobiia bacterium]
MRTLRDRRESSRLRIGLAVAAGALFVVFLSANGIAGLYTDWLWFDKLGVGSVWATHVGAQITLALLFGLLFFAIFWGNLILADRLKPDVRPDSAEEDLVERYHEVVGAQAGRVRLGLALLFSFIAGANTSAQWRTWLLFRNAQDFGVSDPLFNRDAGFYVFRLPLWSFLVDWFFAALVLTLIVVLIAHYLNGGIRPSVLDQRVSRAVKLHVSILMAVLALLRAVDYWLNRYDLVTSKRGAFDGALATDVLIQEPAYKLLALISVFCAGLILFNIWRPGWGLPVVAVAIWLVSHFVVGSAFPLAYQRLRVVPEQSVREALFVGRNIQATRFAFGLDADSVEQVRVAYEEGLTEADVEEYAGVLENVPVVDPFLAVDEVIRNEADRRLYAFNSPLDVDRYTIDGVTRPVVLSARELDVNEVGQGWEQQHVIFTHGYGVAMAAGYDVDGVPGTVDTRELDYLIRGIATIEVAEGLETGLDQPRIYFGDDFDGYAIVGAARQEVDFPTDSQSQLYSYSGSGGVPMDSLLRRIAFALRFRQLDPLISRNITDDSRVIYNRNVLGRVREMAPFLRFDGDPYPVVVEGELFWIIDAYTTTADYPYAQSVSTDLLGAELSRGYNYVRNSVKVVVDAYDGDVTMYVVDESDPLIRAWRGAFPALFTDGSEVPDALRSHFRYPGDLFTVQTDMWSDYVVSDPINFIQGDVAWSVAAQPDTEAETEEDQAAAVEPMTPQYLMARLPGADEPEFVLQRAFVPRSGVGGDTQRPELTGIMMARSDPANYGQLVLLTLPNGLINAPDLVHSEIRKSEAMTAFVLEKRGAKVEYGEMSIVLVDDTIVYIRPVYVEANSATAVPELQRIVAVNGDRIFMANTVADAIAGIASGLAPAAETATDEPVEEDQLDDSGYDPNGRSVVQLIADANAFLASADDLEQNNPDEAERLRQRARQALAAAQGLLGGTTQSTRAESTDT